MNSKVILKNLSGKQKERLVWVLKRSGLYVDKLGDIYANNPTNIRQHYNPEGELMFHITSLEGGYAIEQNIDNHCSIKYYKIIKNLASILFN